MLSLISFGKDSPDCLYSSIASVANSMCTIDYEIIGAGAWWFDLHELMPGQKNALWNRIHTYRYDAWSCLEDYFGVKVTWHNAASADEIMPDIYRELSEKRPVLIYINSHFCPWHPRKNEYNAHFCLVVGFDYEKREFICMDVNPVKYDERLSLKLFSKGCGPYITFSMSDKPRKSINWKEIVSNAMDRLEENGESSFDLMRTFACQLRDEINALQDGIPSWIEYPSSVVSKTGLLEKGRDYFSITLRYLSKHDHVEELIPIAESLNQAAQQWKSVSFLAIKSKLNQAGHNSLVRIPEKILEIADFEEQIASDLNKVLKKE